MLLDFVLRIDVHLTDFVRAYGAWVYALLFAIIFVETGIVVMPFLPGDSLLFVVGAMCGVGLMNLPLAIVLLWVAAVLGDQCNYSIGRYIGPRVFQWENSRWFNKRAFDQAHAFYEKYGGITIVGARFLPFLRTFVPFVAGVAEMTRTKFSFYNVTGGAALGRQPDPGGLPVRQHPVGQGEPREDHLGRGPDPRRPGVPRRLAGAREAAGPAGPGDRRAGPVSADRVAATVHAGVGGALEDLGVAHRPGLGGGPAVAVLAIGLGLRRRLAVARVEDGIGRGHGRHRLPGAHDPVARRSAR